MKLNERKKVLPIDEIESLMEITAQKIPWSTAPYSSVAHWALREYHTSTESDILKHEYLNLARDCAQKAIQLNPGKSSLYNLMAQIYFKMRKYELTSQMLKKSLQLYPYSGKSLKLELQIINEYLKREPDNAELHEAKMKNQIKGLESQLGYMIFVKKLYSSNNLKSLKETLDKQASKLYTDLDFITKAGIKMDITPLARQIADISKEAGEVAGTD